VLVNAEEEVEKDSGEETEILVPNILLVGKDEARSRITRYCRGIAASWTQLTPYALLCDDRRVAQGRDLVIFHCSDEEDITIARELARQQRLRILFTYDHHRRVGEHLPKSSDEGAVAHCQEFCLVSSPVTAVAKILYGIRRSRS
jgi:hypothetical protein